MIYPIVGAHFHRPAKAILAVLPIGTLLDVIPEPDNEYDPNAIAIWVKSDQIPREAAGELDNLSKGYGFNAEEILQPGDMWMLGYIPREIAAKLQPFEMKTGKFSVGANGGPRVEIEI
jgi:hypothetical protein